MNAITIKRCEGCGNEFKFDQRMKKNRKYCSAECYRKYCNYIKMSTIKKEIVVKKKGLIKRLLSYIF